MRNGEDRPEARLEHRERHRRRNLGELLQHQHRIEVAHAVAAVLRRQVDAEEAHLGVALHHRLRDGRVLLLELDRQRGQLLGGEAPGCFLELALLGGEGKVH